MKINFSSENTHNAIRATSAFCKVGVGVSYMAGCSPTWVRAAGIGSMLLDQAVLATKKDAQAPYNQQELKIGRNCKQIFQRAFENKDAKSVATTAGLVAAGLFCGVCYLATEFANATMSPKLFALSKGIEMGSRAMQTNRLLKKADEAVLWDFKQKRWDEYSSLKEFGSQLNSVMTRLEFAEPQRYERLKPLVDAFFASRAYQESLANPYSV